MTPKQAGNVQYITRGESKEKSDLWQKQKGISAEGNAIRKAKKTFLFISHANKKSNSFLSFSVK